jgi:hypothetical protein
VSVAALHSAAASSQSVTAACCCCQESDERSRGEATIIEQQHFIRDLQHSSSKTEEELRRVSCFSGSIHAWLLHSTLMHAHSIVGVSDEMCGPRLTQCL